MRGAHENGCRDPHCAMRACGMNNRTMNDLFTRYIITDGFAFVGVGGTFHRLEGMTDENLRDFARELELNATGSIEDVKKRIKSTESPPFIYTLGLTETYKHAEFVIVGFAPHVLQDTISDAVQVLKENPDAFSHDEIPGVIKCLDKKTGQPIDCNIGCKDVINQAAIDLVAGRLIYRYGRGNFKLKQLFLPDGDMKMSWEEGFDVNIANVQPRLDLMTDEDFM